MTDEASKKTTAPVQRESREHRRGWIAWALHADAYEVYSALYGTQQSAERLAERGGLSESELVAFLHAAKYPRDEWRRRVDEYFRGQQPS